MDTMTKPASIMLDGPYYSSASDSWKGPQGEPQERAIVRGPGIDGTLTGPTAHADARARAQQLNHAYHTGVEDGKRLAVRSMANDRAEAELKKIAARRAKRQDRARRAKRGKR